VSTAKQTISHIRYRFLGIALVLAALPIILMGHASAATPFTKAFLRLNRLQAVTFTEDVNNYAAKVCFRPTSTTAIHSVVVVFPTTSGTDYVLDSTSADWGLDTTQIDTGETALGGTLPANATVSGKTVTVTLTADFNTVNAANTYCFNFKKLGGTGLIKTSSAGATETTQGTITTKDAGSAIINQTTYSESIVASDQVAVSGVVPPSFSFALSGTTDSFTTNLTPATVVSTTGRTITLITNAASGWIVWAQDAQNNGSGQGSLHSTVASHYIADVNGNAPGVASAALNTSSENYGLGVTVTTNGSGSAAADAAYDGTTNKAGSLDPTRFRPIASAGGVTNSDVITVTERANSLATTPAASDYSDTITFVGAGRF